jgi:isochorismate synthase
MAGDVTFPLACLLDGDDGTPSTRTETSPAVQDSCGIDRWSEAVGAITASIEAGDVDKAVLAREVVLRAESAFDVTGAIARLREGYPACTVFAFHRQGASFLGATPERLVRVEGRKVHATCLAGTAPRGCSDKDDGAAAAALMRDEKERREHELVVRMIAGALAPLCHDLDVPRQPTIMTMPNVLHLHTPIEGTLAAHASVLELVERLHPTPAVGGMPLDAALTLIRRHEGFDRGWYAGPVGWIDADGDGEFAVALRSALVRDGEARLFAGCGIVAGSDAQREYDESALKLRPMLGALGQQQPSDNRQQRDER